MENNTRIDTKAYCPKKSFLSRARSSSTSISNFSPNSSSASLKGLDPGYPSVSGLDILATSSELVAGKRLLTDTLHQSGSAEELKLSFSKRNRDDSLSCISLPDEMKISFSELDDPTLNLDDLNFNIPQSIEDAAPSNVTLDLTPKPEPSNVTLDPTPKPEPRTAETSLEPGSATISSTSNEFQYDIASDRDTAQMSNEFQHDVTSNRETGPTSTSQYVDYIKRKTGEKYDSYIRNHETIPCDSNAATTDTSISYTPVKQGNIENIASKISNSECKASNVKELKDEEYTENQSAGSGLGSLFRESTNAIMTNEAEYQRWDTVKELPWADDRLVEELTEVSTTVGGEMVRKKRRRTSGMSKSKKMDNVLCQVCGDMAAGFYCGAYICEACKKFYMRAYKQEKLKYVCLREKKCVITKESRVQCQYCRYQKCLSLNMFCPKQGTEGATSKEAHMSDIPCRVCSAPSSGFHFGAITCEGCKGFFRRMAKERELQRYQCTKDGNCEINMMTRNLCKACRYRECLRAGMSIEGSRIGRQPNSVKHEISLEYQHGGKNDSLQKDPDLIVVKQEPKDYFQECSMSETQKTSSSADWCPPAGGTGLKHSLSKSQLIEQSLISEGYQAKKKSENIMRGLLLAEISASSTPLMKQCIQTDQQNDLDLSLQKSKSSFLPNKVPEISLHSEIESKQIPNKTMLTKTTYQKSQTQQNVQREATHYQFMSKQSSSVEDTPNRWGSSQEVTPNRLKVSGEVSPNWLNSSGEVSPNRSNLFGEVDPNNRLNSPREVTPNRINTSGEVSPNVLTSSTEGTPHRFNYSGEITPNRLCSSVEATPNRLNLSGEVTPNRLNISGETTPNRLSPSVVFPPNRLSPSVEFPPNRFTSSKEVTLDRFNSSEEATPNSWSLSGEVTPNRLNLSGEITPNRWEAPPNIGTCSTEGDPKFGLHFIPHSQNDSVDLDTDSSGSPNEGHLMVSERHNEMKSLINDIIEAARVLELTNYRVFDTNFMSGSKYVVDDVTKKFKDRLMDPRMLNANRFSADMSVFDNKESAWDFTLKPFHDHAYITIRFAKNVPGFRSLEVHDQSILLQSSIYPIVLLYLSKFYDMKTKRYNFFNFTPEETSQILKLFPMLRVLVQHYQHVGEMVSTLRFTNEEFALFAAILLCPAEVKGLRHPEKVEELQCKVSNALQYYEENTYQDGTLRYGSLLVRIAELVQCRLQHKLAIGLLLSSNPNLKVPQLFEELIVESECE